MRKITTISIAALAFLSMAAHAQNKPARQFGQKNHVPCGSTEYEALLRQKDPARPSVEAFERWLAPKTAQQKSARLMPNGMNGNEILTIPIVVHIIHDGDAIGQNENIADAQVLSQITVLNQDFRRMAGTPGHNTSPVGADTEIEFCLAQRDPQGYYTTGIVRHNMGLSTMTMEQAEYIKTLTQWDPEKYLNIWVVRAIVMDGGMGLSGYAQFPVNSGLDGLDGLGLPVAANTDGVVMAYGCFGSEDIYPQGSYFEGFEKGRITAHEIGHFLGLRHIWGDGFDCEATDYCDDTPVAVMANNGCPGDNWDSCPESPGIDMIQNYMDYTDDACKNIFTLDQKDRMLGVLANSPRRVSLLTSDACVPGIVPDNDGSLEIPDIDTGCETTFVPQLILANNGSNTLTSAIITYRIDEEDDLEYLWSGSLAPGSETGLSLPEITAGPGEHMLHTSIEAVNNVPDEVASNDVKSKQFTIADMFSTNAITITVMTDTFAEDTYWRLFDGNGTVVAQASQFLSLQEVVHTIPVTEGVCYRFTIYDLMGDGICCSMGNGFYLVETSDGTVIAGGNNFTDSETTLFGIAGTMGTGGAALQEIRLSPNPAEASLALTLPGASGESYMIFNTLGQKVASGTVSGETTIIDVSGYSRGVYLLQLSSHDGPKKTLRFIKN